MSDTLLLVARVALSLGVVVVLLWFLARRLGGLGGRGVVRPIRVVARHGLSRRAGLAMVDVEGRRMLLGVTDAGVTLLQDLGDAPEPEAALEPEAAQDPGVVARESAFRRTLAGLVPPPPSAAPGVPAAPVGSAAGAALPGGPLAGSILAPSTWRSALRVLRPHR